jgi:SAM-dependent methyltransferase
VNHVSVFRASRRADIMGDPYAAPQTVTDPAACYFYHTMEVPGLGVVEGEWDLRAGVEAYLGGVDVRGKRVLEVGTASGFLCFAMEQRGAEVVACDLSPDDTPDVVPFARADVGQAVRDHREHVRKLNNAFWLCHGRCGSRARVVYGSAYALPAAIGPVDVATFGCVLLHLRDPFLALASAARLTRETIIITEPLVVRSRLKRLLLRALAGPALRFFPDFRKAAPLTTWWVLTPELLRSWLGVLGFEESRVTYHRQMFRGRPVPLFTVVGRRTIP